MSWLEILIGAVLVLVTALLMAQLIWTMREAIRRDILSITKEILKMRKEEK